MASPSKSNPDCKLLSLLTAGDSASPFDDFTLGKTLLLKECVLLKSFLDMFGNFKVSS